MDVQEEVSRGNLYRIAYMAIYIYRVRHIKCYRAIALKLLMISENVREGCHTGLTYFFIGGGAEATSRSTRRFKWSHEFFFR